MPVSLKHLFTSPKMDGTDATLVQPSNWNAEHTLTAGATSVLGNPTATAAAVQELTLGLGLAFSGSSIVAPAFRSINLQTIGPDGSTVVQDTNVIAGNAVGGLRIRALDGITVVAVPGDANNRQMTLALTAHRDPIDFPDPHEQYVQEPAASGLMSFDTATGLATGRTLTQGAGITVTNGDGVVGNPTVANADRGSTAVAAHEAAADPHPQYTTAAEAAAAAPVQSFNGRTGAITPQQADYDAFFTTPAEVTTQVNSALTAAAADAAPGAVAAASALGTSTMFAREDHTHQGVTSVSVNGGAPQSGSVNITTPAAKQRASTTNLFASTANNATVQTALSLAIPANTLTAGKVYRITATGTQSQSAAATNVVFGVNVNGTAITTNTVAGGTAAQTNRGLRFGGQFLYNGTVLYGNANLMVSAVAENFATNVAGVAAAAANTNTINLTVQTSTANAANIIRLTSAVIEEI